MPKTKVEFLYFDGCPTYKIALRDLQDVIKENELDVDLVLMEVKSDAEAERLKFLGSPSIRINGADIEPSARKSKNYRFGCRVYKVGNRMQGFPPKALLMKGLGVA